MTLTPMTDTERCEECGSWEAQCALPEAQPDCGCARCANAAKNELLQTLKLTQKWIGRCEWAGEGMAEMYRTIAMVQKTLDRHTQWEKP